METVTLRMTREQAEELVDLVETAVIDIEHEPAWPSEEPEDEESRERKLASATEILDLLLEQVFGRKTTAN